MSSRLIQTIIVLHVWFAACGSALASSHGELTPVFLRTAALPSGKQVLTLPLPVGADGPLPQALVLMGARPAGTVEAAVAFRVAGKQLPGWAPAEKATAYVINRDTLRSNPLFKQGRLEIEVTVTTTAGSVDVALFGMPDLPALAGEALDGPLDVLAQESADPEVKIYLGALSDEIGERLEKARAAYRGLATSPNLALARFARRGLRKLAYRLRKRQLSGDHDEHLRWALYLDTCGFVGPARQEYNECRILTPQDALSQYRTGTLNDRMGYRVLDVYTFMERAARSFTEPPACEWDVLFVILKSRTAAPAGVGPLVQSPVLGSAELVDIKNHWLMAERIVHAASRGLVRINTVFLELEDERQYPLVEYGGAWGLSETLIERRGWFDAVVCVRPRSVAEAGLPNRTVGGDLGPNGAALSDMYFDSTWRAYLTEWHRQFEWAAQRTEAGRGYPSGQAVWRTGRRPNRDATFGVRAALHDFLTPAAARRMDVVDPAAPGSHIRFWSIEGPYPVEASAPAAGLPGRHAADPIPAGAPQKTVVVDSETDFVDLATVFPKAGWSRAVAKTWVYSPSDGEVRMWIGQNDGAAVWVNGRLVHEGRQYSTGRYLDLNRADTVASYAPLKKGWNELRVVVESWPAPHDKGWGFSIRLCDWSNRPIRGLAYSARTPPRDQIAARTQPEIGRRYDWSAVRDAFQGRLPLLTETDLAQLTGIQGIRITGGGKGGGAMAIVAPGRPESKNYRAVSANWQSAGDRDVVLNNVLDWEREEVAALHTEKGGQSHDLLFLRPTAIEAYLTLLHEPRLITVGPTTPPSSRILGYVVVSGEPSDRVLLVVDATLGGDRGWPTDEEDLLRPPVD